MTKFKIELKSIYSITGEEREEAIEEALKQLEYDILGGVDLKDIFQCNIIAEEG